MIGNFIGGGIGLPLGVDRTATFTGALDAAASTVAADLSVFLAAAGAVLASPAEIDGVVTLPDAVAFSGAFEAGAADTDGVMAALIAAAAQMDAQASEVSGVVPVIILSAGDISAADADIAAAVAAIIKASGGIESDPSMTESSVKTVAPRRLVAAIAT